MFKKLNANYHITIVTRICKLADIRKMSKVEKKQKKYKRNSKKKDLYIANFLGVFSPFR